MRSPTLSELKLDGSRLANGEALLVAILVGLSLGFGEIIAFGSTDVYSIMSAMLSSVLLVVLTTTVWAGVVFLIGTRIFKGSTDFLGLARPIFFSVTPGLFLVLTSLSVARPYISWLLSAWIIVINAFIARESMSLSSQRSILTVFISAWIMILAGGTLGLF